jgi:hypothetical protein
MKKIVLIIAAMIAGREALAGECNAEKSEQPAVVMQRPLLLKKALVTLANAGAISVDENQALKINESFLDELRQQGLMTELDAKEGVVCIGAGQ